MKRVSSDRSMEEAEDTPHYSELDRAHGRPRRDTLNGHMAVPDEEDSWDDGRGIDAFDKREPTRPIAAMRVVPVNDAIITQEIDDSITALYPSLLDTSVIKKIEDELRRLTEVSGFMGILAMLPGGEVLTKIDTPALRLGDLSAVANQLLIRAHSAAAFMQVGDRGVTVDMIAEHAFVLLRCMHASADTHLHLCLAIGRTGNKGLATLWLDRVIEHIDHILAH